MSIVSIDIADKTTLDSVDGKTDSIKSTVENTGTKVTSVKDTIEAMEGLIGDLTDTATASLLGKINSLTNKVNLGSIKSIQKGWVDTSFRRVTGDGTVEGEENSVALPYDLYIPTPSTMTGSVVLDEVEFGNTTLTPDKYSYNPATNILTVLSTASTGSKRIMVSYYYLNDEGNIEIPLATTVSPEKSLVLLDWTKSYNSDYGAGVILKGLGGNSLELEVLRYADTVNIRVSYQVIEFY